MDYVTGYEDGRAVVLRRRREDGTAEVRRVPADYAMFLRGEDVGADLERQLRGSRHVATLTREDGWVRVGWASAEARRFMSQDRTSPLASRGIPTYEADVDPVVRHLVDTGASVQLPRRVYLDIETDSRVPFARKEEMRLLSWALVDDTGRAHLAVLEEDADGAERDLLGELFEALAPYDQVAAWHGDGFDFPVLAARAERAGLRVGWRDWLWLDHLVLFGRMNMHSAESGEEKQSMRLQSIAMAVLGEGKDDFDAAHTYEAWAAGGEERERLARYNLKDTDLLRRIEQKTGYIDLFATLCQTCGVFGDTSGLNPVRQMDGFLLRLARARGHRFPTREFRPDVAERFKGAFVMEPQAKGIERDVHVADFASLYPSIIITWNMSPDTLVPVPVNGPLPSGRSRSPLTGAGFTTERVGILPDALRELLRLRVEWNEKKAASPPGTPAWHDADRRSTAYKVAANSFYGVMGTPFSRYYQRTVAEAVTQCGVWLIRETIAAAQVKGWRVVYGDTDSLFVAGSTKEDFEAFVAWCNAELYPRLLRSQGCVENRIKLAYEKAFARVVFVSAKRYAGAYAHYKGKAATADSKPEVKGLEYKRGDAALLARRLQERVIAMLMAGEENLEEYRAVLYAAREHVLLDPLPVEEVRLSKSLQKPLEEYAQRTKLDGTAAGQPPHVTVAKLLAARGQEVSEGTRIEYVVADGSASPARVIPAEDYTGVEADRIYVWESLVYPPTERLLTAAFPHAEAEWGEWARARAPKRGASKAAKARAGQPDLFGQGGILEPLEVRLTSSEQIERVRELLRRHPGERPVRLRVVMAGGAEALLTTPLRVDGSARLMGALKALGAA